MLLIRCCNQREIFDALLTVGVQCSHEPSQIGDVHGHNNEACFIVSIFVLYIWQIGDDVIFLLKRFSFTGNAF